MSQGKAVGTTLQVAGRPEAEWGGERGWGLGSPPVRRT